MTSLEAYQNLAQHAEQSALDGISLRSAWTEFLAQNDEKIEKAIGKENKNKAWFFFERIFTNKKREMKNAK